MGVDRTAPPHTSKMVGSHPDVFEYENGGIIPTILLEISQIMLESNDLPLSLVLVNKSLIFG